MPFIRLHTVRALLCCALPLLPVMTAAAPGPVVTTPQVRAELVAHAPEGLAAGQTIHLGLKIDHQPHWHTYWKNPGDSGLPTTLTWQLPQGMTPGDIQWPTPQKLPIGPLMNYGFEDTLLLPVALQLPASWSGEQLTVKLQAQWLVCKEVCIPEEGEFALDIPARAATASHTALFQSTWDRVPQPVAGAEGSAAVEGTDLVVTVQGLPVSWQGKALTLFPELGGVINNASKPQVSWQGDRWTAKVALDPQRSESPTQLVAVLTQPGAAAGVQVSVPVTTAWPSTAQAAPLPPLQEGPGSAGATNAATPAATAAISTSLLGALLLALAGGALLNLMPCVFPILSLKVLGFQAQAGDRRALLAGGLAYTAGVVLSFVALAGLMLALRAGGEQLGWGFQLQSPLVVAGLATLFTLIGLNLAGVFELGSVLPSSWASARARHPTMDSALTGVLAVAVASPCTAPFMGAALGLALGLPVAQALLIFGALGLGMALPYLLASAWPPLARALPRPGVWMAHFKVLMAFPMFATVVWLLWVLGQQVGLDGTAALLGLLVALSFAAWAWGSPALGKGARWGLGSLAAVCLTAVALWAWPALHDVPAPAAAQGESTATSADGWTPWSSQAVAQAQSQGRSVFVDFTAAWCVTCQYNKRTTLADARVKAAFADKQVLLMRADWTRRDAAITAELGRLQRSGVPVYAMYRPDAAAPQLLPEVLQVDVVLAAVAALPQGQ